MTRVQADEPTHTCVGLILRVVLRFLVAYESIRFPFTPSTSTNSTELGVIRVIISVTPSTVPVVKVHNSLSRDFCGRKSEFLGEAVDALMIVLEVNLLFIIFDQENRHVHCSRVFPGPRIGVGLFDALLCDAGGKSAPVVGDSVTRREEREIYGKSEQKFSEHGEVGMYRDNRK
jgi:hypothetical protein